SYWIPNKDVHECSTCKLVFGSNHSKHHCRGLYLKNSHQLIYTVKPHCLTSIAF
ncbi:unnamed protein product, partial [Rotaria magnacalcarata]